MTSLSEILILRGAVPIEALDRMTGDPARDEQWIIELIDNDQVSPEPGRLGARRPRGCRSSS